ncbi:multidrug effflux MFS transporter [Pararhizobium sp.]|uniref:multidrug effflux MFS transporter n=1 Tax=Pararhizobium sp. TaxID=1977563 RepID=UPI002722369A|nr:multidrug effflux MFS transporter [Pararhizobium sp.]MDO9417112.1 multidrug effflux MFS transporter [Pararhizobium sp.]
MTISPQGHTIAVPSKYEFIALTAMLMAINALAIDIMLPGLQQIGASLGVTDENHRQYVISAYLIGMGVAQLAFGPLSDRYGRKAPLLAGIGIYVVCAFSIALVPSFAGLLALRLMQGVGAAATRVIAVSVVRDIYGGRQMAEIMSLVMMVFMIIPVIAPSIGQGIMLFAEWHMIFVFIGLYGLFVAVMVYTRLPETLAPEHRRPLSIASVSGAFRIVLTNRTSLFYNIGTSVIFGSLFGFINSAQQILVGIYGLGVWFPLAFAGFASMMAIASFANSRLVQRFGMRRLSHTALILFALISAVFAGSALLGSVPFWLFAIIYGLALMQFGIIAPNFNSMAMEPLGAVAGTASSVLGFSQTIGGALIGAAIGQAFDGTVTPLAVGFLIVSVLGLIFVFIAENGKLFRPHNEQTGSADGTAAQGNALHDVH